MNHVVHYGLMAALPLGVVGLISIREPVPRAIWIVAAASFSAGAIHAAVTGSHAREYWLFGAFFALSAVSQIAWAVLVVARGSRWLLIAGAVGNALVVALWVMSRTAGLPLGPVLWRPEAIGAADVISTLCELVVVAGCVATSRAARSRLSTAH